MDAETLIQIGSGSFVVSSESQYIAQASPNALPDQTSNLSSTEQPQKAPNSPSLIGKLKSGTTTRISSIIDKKPSTSSTNDAPSSTPASVATTPAPVTATTASPAPQPTSAKPTATPTPPQKPAKSNLTNTTDTPPKRPPPTLPSKPTSTTTAASPAPKPEPQQPAPQTEQSVPEGSGELDISEYHYDYTSGNTSTPSLIPNDKRKTVVNPRMSTMFDTFSTTSAFGNPKDFSGMFGSDSPT